jgi:enoyl-CoA hydratase
MGKFHYEIGKDGIALITMDDGKANAMDDAFFREMQQSLDQADKDQPKIVAIKGRPGYFSGGLNLKYIMTLSQNELGDFVFMFARTLLRVYALPIPTVALSTGHAIAGGAMLTFACDLRFIAQGSYKIQMNESLIGISLPTWMLIIANSAIPPQWRTEALLHAHAYDPEEAVKKNIFNGFLEDGDDVLTALKSSIEPLLNLNVTSYAATKKRMRKPEEIDSVLGLLRHEIG